MKPLRDYSEWPLFAVYDIETIDKSGQQRFGTDVVCLCHVDEFGNRRDFTGDNIVSRYLDWLYSMAFMGECVWAHWGGRFDHQFVMHECYKRGYTFEVVLSGNLMVVFAVTNGEGRTIKFCESARIMPDSVESIGKSIGLQKLDVDRTHLDILSLEKTIEYCYRDCDIPLQGLINMRNTLVNVGRNEGMEAAGYRGGFDFAFTLASMSTRYVRRSNVLDWKKFYVTDNETKKLVQSPEFKVADDFAYEAYHGGDTQAYCLGEFLGPLYYYDITSSYPANMMLELPAYFLRFDAPIRTRSRLGSVDIERSLQRCGITDAWVTIPRGSMLYPLLPVRFERKDIKLLEADAASMMAMRQDQDVAAARVEMTPGQLRALAGKVLFIEGGFRRKWTNIELLALWRHMRDVPGFEMELYTQAIYEPLPFMKPFVELFWNMRQHAIQQGDEFKKYTYKIAMNSASGKMAEQITKHKVVHGAAVGRAIRDYGPEAVRMTGVVGIYTVEHEAEGAFRHAAAAAYVTARTRIQLWEAKLLAQQQGARVYYNDTDSIIVDKPIFGEAKAKTLGAWHLETTIKRCEIWAPKCYMYEAEPTKDNPSGMTYRVKGMPIERREDKEHPERIAERWLDYVAMHKGLDRPEPVREGIYGLTSNLNAGRVYPEPFALKRSAKTKDTKRQHAGGMSKPHFYKEQSTRGDPNDASAARTMREVR